MSTNEQPPDGFEPKRKFGRESKYPWNEWLDQNEHTIYQITSTNPEGDFAPELENMRSQIKNAATKANLDVQIDKHYAQGYIVLRAFPPRTDGYRPTLSNGVTHTQDDKPKCRVCGKTLNTIAEQTGADYCITLPKPNDYGIMTYFSKHPDETTTEEMYMYEKDKP